MVFAKKSEKTGSTARDLHSGQAGRLRTVCSAIVSVREKRALHAVQRYSYSGMPETLFPRKTTVKLTHRQPPPNWRMRPIVLLALVIAGCGGGLQPEPIVAPSIVGLCGTRCVCGAVPESRDNLFVA